MNHLLKSIALLALVGLVTGCQSVERDLHNEAMREARPPINSPGDSWTQKKVTVPDLDVRNEEDHSLSQMDRLRREVSDLRQKIELAAEERDAAISQRDSARQGELQLIEQNQQQQGLLAAATERERTLKAQLLQAQIENVRLKQDLADRRIRELSTKAGQ